ncbi:hypothetical protein DIC66_10470 [Rhodoferax lacus]|uniref:TPM domain-containing protein n=1 Tax=Rhodoferax lacus TaxID=2184758 RepID=A0A3E1RD04_9BURK|nr:TPM domain-containing protein [Rhodoferax lacus]RFO96912.1 hypothetical protein DIC66_10470 [Rhodoferax lacus]
MDLRRILRHLLFTKGRLHRAFSASTLAAIEQAIHASEQQHAGEICFAVEGALDGLPLFKGQTARGRALEVFAQLRVWDTEHNNGVLIYVLLADHAVEIVADRGIHARAGAQTWSAICQQMEGSFSKSYFESAVLNGIQDISSTLAGHFPKQGATANELPDAPVLLN